MIMWTGRPTDRTKNNEDVSAYSDEHEGLQNSQILTAWHAYYLHPHSLSWNHPKGSRLLEYLRKGIWQTPRNAWEFCRRPELSLSDGMQHKLRQKSRWNWLSSLSQDGTAWKKSRGVDRCRRFNSTICHSLMHIISGGSLCLVASIINLSTA